MLLNKLTLEGLNSGLIDTMLANEDDLIFSIPGHLKSLEYAIENGCAQK